MPSPELAQRRKGIKTHRPERSSDAGFLSQGSPQRTRQFFCAVKKLATKKFRCLVYGQRGTTQSSLSRLSIHLHKGFLEKLIFISNPDHIVSGLKVTYVQWEGGGRGNWTLIHRFT